MKITYDPEAQAAYIYLKDNIANGEAVRTIYLAPNINIDKDKDGTIIGIEIYCDGNLPPDFVIL